MANFSNPGSPTWVVDVPKVEITDPAQGGAETAALNKTGKALVERTGYLKTRVDAISLTVVGGTDTFGPISGGTGFVIANPIESEDVSIDIHPTSNPAGTWGEWWAVYTEETVTVHTSGTYSGTVRWTLRRTTQEV